MNNPQTPAKTSAELRTSPGEPLTPRRRRKGVLDEKSLMQNHVRFEKNLLTSDGLALLAHENPQAALLTEELLDFDEVLSVGTYNRLSFEEQEDLKTHNPTARIEKAEPLHPDDLKDFRSDYQLDYHDLSFDIAKKTNTKVKAIRSMEEQRWVGVIRSLIDQLVEDCQNLEGRENLKPNQIVKGVRVEGEQTWTLGANLFACDAPCGAPVLTSPKVDRYFGLPITNLGFPSDCTPTTTRSQLRGLSKDYLIQNFDYSTLRDLSDKGLVANACCSLTQDKKAADRNKKAADRDKKAAEKYMVCFPGRSF